MTAGSLDAGPIVATILVRTFPNCSLCEYFIQIQIRDFPILRGEPWQAHPLPVRREARGIVVNPRAESQACCERSIDQPRSPVRGWIRYRATPMDVVRADSPHRQSARPSPAAGGRGDDIADVGRSVREEDLADFQHGREHRARSKSTPRNDCRQERAARSAPRGTKTSACPITSARSATLRLSKYDQNGTIISGFQNGGSGQANRQGFQAVRTTTRLQIKSAGMIQRRASPAAERTTGRRPEGRAEKREHDRGDIDVTAGDHHLHGLDDQAKADGRRRRPR